MSFGPAEPGIAAMVAVEAAAAEVDWDVYQKCGICGVGMGEACRSQSGRIYAGRPDGVRALLPRAHGHRKRRAGR